MSEDINDCQCDLCQLMKDIEEHKKILMDAGMDSTVCVINKMMNKMFSFSTDIIYANRLIEGTWPGADTIIEDRRKLITGKDMVH